MRHLKRFNESNEEDIKVLIEQYLAYILDDMDLEIINDRVFKNDITIILSNNSSIYWKDIKDDIIPFIQILKDNGYEFTKLTLNTWYFGTKEYTLNDVLNDKPSEIDNTNQLMNLNIKIFKKPNERG